MKIDELPTEMLMNIFGYLSNYKKLSLVNRRFYEIACELNDKNLSLILNRHVLHSTDNTLQSIKESDRKISKLEINLFYLTEEDLLTLLSIISNFSGTIKYLRILGGVIGLALFIEILSLVPNAKHLSFEGLCLSNDDEMPSDEDVNLKHLRILDLSSCCKQVQLVFNRLPAGVITELKLRGGYLLSLDTFFSRQTNIKKLSLVHSVSDAHFIARILNNLELESLNMQTWVIEMASLSKQKKLKSLTVTENYEAYYPVDNHLMEDVASLTVTENYEANYPVDNHLMEDVANSFSELEELDWAIKQHPVIDFVTIKRLKNLKHLRLDITHSRTDILGELIKFDNSQIATLELSNLCHLTDQQIQTLATSAPTLKVFKVYRRLSSEQTIAVLKYFNFVECLSLSSLLLQRNYNKNFNQRESGNPKLTELIISEFQYEADVLAKMIADFPNIKKLQIVIGNRPKHSHFRLILDGLTKLESMELQNLYGQGKLLLTIDDFKYLRDHRKCLQTLRLRGLRRQAFINPDLEGLEAMFQVVEYSGRCQSLLLKM